MAKSRERLRARELRRGGKSIREIAKKLNVSKGTVSLWCRDIVLTEEQVENLMQRDIVGGCMGRMRAWEWHRQEKKSREACYHAIGYTRFNKITNNDLYFIGLALYWSEGSKRDRRLLLTKLVRYYRNTSNTIYQNNNYSFKMEKTI